MTDPYLSVVGAQRWLDRIDSLDAEIVRLRRGLDCIRRGPIAPDPGAQWASKVAAAVLDGNADA